MWRLRLKLKPKGQFLGTMAMKYQISLAGYTLSYYKDKKWLYVTMIGLIFGEKYNKKLFIRNIKKQKNVVSIEINNDFIIAIIKEPIFSEPIYDSKIIRPSPAIINKNGYHIWDLASFDRKILERVISFVEKNLEGNILTFRQEKITNVSFVSVLPELTSKQKKAMEIAISNHYYEYPKKMNMKKLAKIMGISYSTYQAHLKKAEGKLLPSIFRRL